MSAAAPRQVLHRCRLSPEDQARLDDLVDEHGCHRVAQRLGVNPTTVEKLAYGGCSTADACERVAERLAGVVR